MNEVIPVLPVGPGDADRQRLPRLVRALMRHEPDLPGYVVLYDGIDPAAVDADLAGLGPAPTLIENPRRGRGVPSFDGQACGLTAAYRHVATAYPGAHAWKLDTDAYVIGPCRQRISDFLAPRPETGVIGTVDSDCDGVPRDDAFRRLGDVHRKYLWPVWYWRSLGKLSTPLFGSGRRFASYYRGVDRAKGRRGRYVQGGSYAVNATLLAAWLKAGRLDDPESWLNAPVGEDMAFSMMCVIAGFLMTDFNRPGQVFGVKNAGLPLPPDDLVGRGYGVVHSVKGPTWDAELATIAALDAAVAKGEMPCPI